jgi:hypothetical protein
MKDYFPESEFPKCKPPCKKEDMHPDFMTKLNKTREAAGIPFTLVSAGRTPEWEKENKRDGKSDHVYDKAMKARGVDVKALDGRSKYLIITAALKNGFTRIGVHRSFIHLGDAPHNPPQVFWAY